jgi:hypothetical protein
MLELQRSAAAYFYVVPAELKQFLQISSYKCDVPNGTNEFSNGFLEGWSDFKKHPALF